MKDGIEEYTKHYYTGNHLSSTQLVTDGTGVAVQQVEYAPFGEVVNEYNIDWSSGQVPDFKFNGKELDEESGMYYFEARYQNPPVFISRDPLFEARPYMSPYAYCSNSPVNRVDPNGMLDDKYYNLNGKEVHDDHNGSDNKKLVITTNNQQLANLDGQYVIDMPTNETVNKMAQIYQTDSEVPDGQSGVEYGFFVGDKNSSSQIIQGTETKIPAETCNPALNELHDRGEAVAYMVHLHPQNGRSGGRTKPSTEDINTTFGITNVGVLLGYGKYPSLDNFNVIGGDNTRTLRQIAFYNKNGLITKPMLFSEFEKMINKVNKLQSNR